MNKINFECFSKIYKHFSETSMFKYTGFSDWDSLVNVEFLEENRIKFSIENNNEDGCIISRYMIEYSYGYSSFYVLSESYFYERPNED